MKSKFRPLFSAFALTTIVLSFSQSAQAVTYYWDNDGTTAGFGTAAGTWAAPTMGGATQGWSTSPTGVLLPGNVTTANTNATTDAVNFGNGATGLGAGTITVGTVDSGPITFAAGSGAITLSGGTITQTAVQTITVNNVSDTINSILAGAATSLTKAGTGILNLGGANTYTGTTAVNAGRLQFTNTASLYNGDSNLWTANNLRVASGATLGLNVGGAGESTTGNVTSLLSNLGGLGGAPGNGLGLQAGSAIAFDTTNASGGNFTVADAIANSTGPGGGAIGVTKLGTGTLTLSGANTYTGATTLSGGTLKAGSASAFTSKGTLSMSGTATFDLAGSNAGFTNITASAITNSITNSGTADATLNISGLGTQISALITDGPTNKLAISFANNNSAANLFKLDSPNTFSGGITLLSGTGSGTRLRITNAITTVGTPGAITSSPYGTGAITIGQSATDKAGILFDGVGNNTLVNAIVFNTALGTDVPGIRFDTTGHTLSGNITANLADATFSSGGGNTASAILTGKITGSSGLALTPPANAGSPTLTLTLNSAGGPNDYAGNTTISKVNNSNYTLKLGAANQIPNGVGKGNVVNNGRLDLNTFSETINGLSGSGIVDTVAGGASVLTVGDNNQTSTFDGIIRNTAGTLALVKTGSGTLTLTGASTFGGGTTVSQGRLVAANSSALGTNSSLNLAAGTTFAYQPAVAGALALGTGSLTLNGNTINTAIGGTVSQSAITSSGAASATGAVTVNVRQISGVPTTAGANDLITVASGLTSGGATYLLGKVFNATDFTVIGFTSSDTAITLNTAAATALTGAFWKGGLAGADNVWSLSNGSTASNWASDIGGTATPLVPGVGADVIFSANGATNQGAMVLGETMTIKSLNVNGTSPVTLNGDGFTLNIVDAAAINVSSGAGAVTLNANIAIGAGQTWTNNSSNTLTFGGPVRNGANLLTLAGTGATTISNFQGGTGGLTVSSGTTTVTNATLQGAQTWTNNSANTLTGSTVSNGNFLLTTAGTGSTLISNLLGGSGGLTVSDGSTTITTATLSASQTWTNNSATPLGLSAGSIDTNGFVLTAGGTGTSEITGLISGSGGFTKSGSGTLTLSGANNYSGATIVNGGIVNLNNANAFGDTISGTRQSGTGQIRLTGGLVTAAEPLNINGGGFGDAGALRNISGDNTYSGTITMADQSRINSDAGTLTLNAATSVNGNTNLIIGGAGDITILGEVAIGTGFVARDGTGTLTLSGANTYTGMTSINGGTIKAGSAVAFTNKGTLNMGGSGVFDLNGFSSEFTGAASAATNTITNSGASDAVLKVNGNPGLNALITDGATNKLGITFGANANSGTNAFNIASNNTFSGGILLAPGTATGAGNITRLRATGGTISGNPFGTGAITIGETTADRAGVLFDNLSGINTVSNDFVVNTIQGPEGVVLDKQGIRIDANAANMTFTGKLTAGLTNVSFAGNGGAATATGQITGVTNGFQTTGSVAITLNNSAENNNYAGDTLVQNTSKIILGRANQIPDTSSVTVSGGTLDIGAFSETVDSVKMTGGSITGIGGILTASSYNLQAGSVSAILGGSGSSLTKTAGTTVTLSGTNTYTGLTSVNDGTLALGATGSIANSSGVVLGGGTFDVSAKGPGGYAVNNLSGNGSVIGAISVSTQLSIGASAGTISFESLTLDASSTYAYELTGGGTSADLGLVASNLTLSGGMLDLVQLAGGVYTPGDKFTLFGYSGSFSGNFKDTSSNVLAEGATFNDAGGDWQITYIDTTPGLNGGTGSSFVNIVAIPEPSSVALLGIFGGLALLRRRR